jgi:PadR family transcriptional regulator AphA
MASDVELPLGSWAVLALLCEGDSHGWAIVRAMEPHGEIGRVWSVRRALVYRLLNQAVAAGMVEQAGLQRPTRGPERTLLHATTETRSMVESWLRTPVDHVRDLRSAFLLKLLFTQRAGRDAAGLLEAQQRVLEATIHGLEERTMSAPPSERAMYAFRFYTARAGLDFVADALAQFEPVTSRTSR